ncbi:hypothetical protein BH11PSE9_BH11PSE9_15300 [soil metagenome]
MTQPDTVVVFNFRTLEGGHEFTHLLPFKATREAIESVFGGTVLEGTGQRVERAELDESGRYRRVATGWGELD